jgi:hypothetical protein
MAIPISLKIENHSDKIQEVRLFDIEFVNDAITIDSLNVKYPYKRIITTFRKYPRHISQIYIATASFKTFYEEKYFFSMLSAALYVRYGSAEKRIRELDFSIHPEQFQSNVSQWPKLLGAVDLPVRQIEDSIYIGGMNFFSLLLPAKVGINIDLYQNLPFIV